jgi:hypothetical protein
MSHCAALLVVRGSSSKLGRRTRLQQQDGSGKFVVCALRAVPCVERTDEQHGFTASVVGNNLSQLHGVLHLATLSLQIEYPDGEMEYCILLRYLCKWSILQSFSRMCQPQEVIHSHCWLVPPIGDSRRRSCCTVQLSGAPKLDSSL